MAGRCTTARGPGDPGIFPPEDEALIKAVACDRPQAQGRPLARLSVFDICRRVWDAGLNMSYSTVHRRLAEDLIRPWFQRGWIFPRDPQFLAKATPVLELYRGVWGGEPLRPGDRVLCADEMPGIQALRRIHASLPAGADRKARTEFEYQRLGTLAYLAFLDVFTGRVTGRVHPSTGIEPFQQTLLEVLRVPAYAEAERIFLIVDNGCSHHPSTSPARLRALDPRIVTVHLPTHASWLNQIEIFFSILVRKALRPADFQSLDELRARLYGFTSYYNREARPYAWKFTPEKLKAYLAQLATKSCEYADKLRHSQIDIEGKARCHRAFDHLPALPMLDQPLAYF